MADDTRASEAAEAPAARNQATVASRRTVQVNGKSHGPGAIVTLPAKEIARLRELGYLVDPKAAEILLAEGSSVTSR